MEDNERIELARLVDAEAADQPLDGMIAVVRVVLYRWARWRDYGASGPTLHEVIMAHGQFESVADGRFESISDPSDDAQTAVDIAMGGYDPLPEPCGFFYNPVIVRKRGGNWVSANTTPVRVIGRHLFAKGRG